MSALAKIITAAGILVLILSGTCWLLMAKGQAIWNLAKPDDWIEIYQKNARTPVFSALVTMGSFLLALKTNILARIKETYDTGEYLDAYRNQKSKNSNFRYYGSLENLGNAIGVNVFLCLLTALLQMTVGFIWHPAAVAFCCGLAAATVGLLLYLTLILMKAHRDWFASIEEQRVKQIKEWDKQNKEAENQPCRVRSNIGAS